MQCQLKAVEAGAEHIDTAVSSFSGGASHPATESQVASVKDTAWYTGLDLTLLQEIADYFREVRKKYHQFESEFTREDVSVQINQVPGGMMFNLPNQLKEQHALGCIREVFEDIPRVRKDLGYPPAPVDPQVQKQAIGNDEIVDVRSADLLKPELQNLRAEIGELTLSDAGVSS